MNQNDITDIPKAYTQLEAKCDEIGFSMPSDVFIGTLLKSLVSSKPGAHVLELGTGMSLSLAWMLDGLDEHSRLVSIDNDPQLISIANDFFGTNSRVDLVCADGGEWIRNYTGDTFDLIFADAWPGKYSDLDETLHLLKVGGFYVIDDMNPQPNWPDGHAKKAQLLVEHLESRTDLTLTKMDWSTGVIIAVKR